MVYCKIKGCGKEWYPNCGNSFHKNMNSNSEHYRVIYSDITGQQWPREVRGFPPIRPSGSHVVLYKPSKDTREKPPVPYKRQNDNWDDNHVRLPQSNWNQYQKESFWAYKTLSRWTIFKKSFEKKIKDSKALIGAILKYNGKFKDVWKFEALEHYLNTHLTKDQREDFFNNTLPGIIKLALQLPDLIQAPIPLLKQNQNRSLSLSQEQIASLLANAFLCTFPRRNTAYPNSEAAKLPRINFASLYERPEPSVNQKLRCICNYFRRVISKTPTGVVTFSRRFVKSSKWEGSPSWETSADLIKSIPVYVDSKRIEDATGLIQVDFANKFVGGGVLGSGLVQEEIRFLMCPELMVSMIFTEALGPQEALMIIGCERYNDCKGYGHETFRWSGDHRDSTPVDSSGRRRCAVLAIDAEPYWDPAEQFQKRMIERELTKAWIGFSFFRNDSKPDQLLFPGVATGNWGCGAFNGDPQLKCLLQIMAAAAAKRPLAYYTFGDTYFKREVESAYEWLKQHDVTVGELFKCIIEYDKKKDLYSFLNENFEEKLTQYRSADKPCPIRPQYAGTSTKDVKFETRSQVDHHSRSQGEPISDHHNRPPTNYNYDQPQHDAEHTPSNFQSSKYDGKRSQNMSEICGRHGDRSEKEWYGQQQHDAKHTPSNFQSSKNDGQRSQNMSEICGRHGDSSEKEWSQRNHGGTVHSQNKMNHDERTRNCRVLKPSYPGPIGGLTEGLIQMTRPILYSEALKGMAQLDRQNSSNIYRATNNYEAFMMRTAADGRPGTDSASGENLINFTTK